jgi:hypothetical protein
LASKSISKTCSIAASKCVSQVPMIMASKCISKFSQSAPHGAPSIMLQYRLHPDWLHAYI